MNRTGARERLIALYHGTDALDESELIEDVIRALEAEARDREALRLAAKIARHPAYRTRDMIADDIRAEVRKGRKP